MAITSAAIPAFQHRPSPTVLAVKKYGATAGMYRYLAFLKELIRNTLAISSNFSSVDRIPCNTFVYITGTVIKKEVRIDKFFDGIHSNARIIKEATGVACITFINGVINSLITRNLQAKIAKRIPIPTAIIKPAIIFIKEKRTDFQNTVLYTKLTKAIIVVAGDAKSILLLTAILSTCQNKSQNAAANILYRKA